MPVRRVRVDDELERAVEDIERTERVVSMVMAGDGCLILSTEPRKQHRLGAASGEKETR